MREKPIATLLELLDEYKVEIPIVQRDYAQGRKNAHAKVVRSNLLKDMKTAILSDTPLDLSFVYGKAENKKFIPIDGQQRLTTLFLLHLYAFRKDASKTPLLHHFTYETRITSREFLKRLIENRAEIFASNLNPSAEIEDSEWFVSSWSYDPSIQSALVMLDNIENLFHDVDILADRLMDANHMPITFQFLEMQDLGMEDSLYIKLNARGKPLTEFENFKAQLIGRMKKLKLPYIDEFERHFDCEWTDLFWNKYKKDFDKTYYAFFGILLMNYGIIEDDRGWAHTLDYGTIDMDIFYAAFYTLNFLCEDCVNEKISALVFDALSEGRTYTNRVLFHAVVTYLFKTRGENTGSMEAWIRILKNLAQNSDIDNLYRYHNAIEAINALTEHWDNLVHFFAEGNRVSGFNQSQIEEEQRKAGIILATQSFADKIYEAEQHPYFSGQIRCALYLAKKEDGTYEEDRFAYYWTKIAALFDSVKPKYGDLLRRALLTLGDYTLWVSQFKTLCVDDPNETARTPSMKSLFSSCGAVTKLLLERLDFNGDIKAQLEQIVANSDVKGNDWRYCFIQYPQLFRRMSVSHLRLRELHGGEMHMIQNKWANGYNYDLFLSALHEELKEQNIASQFDDQLGTSVQHCLFVKQYKVEFRKGKFYVRDETGEIVFQTQSDAPVSETSDFIAG